MQCDFVKHLHTRGVEHSAAVLAHTDKVERKNMDAKSREAFLLDILENRETIVYLIASRTSHFIVIQPSSTKISWGVSS